MNNGGVFTRNKVDTSLYIFPNSAQTASTHFSLKLPAVPKGDCLASLAGWDMAAREKEKRVANFTHVCHPEPDGRTDVGKDAEGLLYPRSSAVQIPRLQDGGRGVGGMIELSHLTLHYRPVSKTLPPPLGLHLSCPSLKTSGFILEGQGQPSRKCRRRLR